MTTEIKNKLLSLQSPVSHIRASLIAAIAKAFGAEHGGIAPAVIAARNEAFGDFQSNVAMILAKSLPPPPVARKVAEQIVAYLTADDVFEQPTVAGPGFINFKLQTKFVELQIDAMSGDQRLGVSAAALPQKVFVDMSSPNIAKEMHVGHLRSTIIGEAIARLLAFLGHEVEKVNHVGDWGTQFGMLIAELKEQFPQALSEPDSLDLGDLVAFYKKAKEHFDADPAFAETARQEVVKLQGGDKDSIRAWELLCNQSRQAFELIYDQLDVKDLLERGESMYNPELPGIVQRMLDDGVAVEDQGAVCVYLDGFKNREGQPLPLIIRKQDGGFNYATTDLAAMRYRVQNGGNLLLYVVDAGQSQHLQMVTLAARKAGFVPGDVDVAHIPFGLVLGKDGGKLKTRSGETLRLQDLLDDAVTHARNELVRRLSERGQSESAAWIDAAAKAIGIGAVKYNDLYRNRGDNYKFELGKALSLDGNTAPFILYAYARVQGIGRESGVDIGALSGNHGVVLAEPLEVELAKQLLKLNDTLHAAAGDFLPNRICEYLFELSQRFNRFYHEHQVLNVPEPVRTSRLMLCDLTARTLKLGLTLLGIRTLERM